MSSSSSSSSASASAPAPAPAPASTSLPHAFELFSFDTRHALRGAAAALAQLWHPRIPLVFRRAKGESAYTDRQMRRTCAVRELVATEQSYIDRLSFVLARVYKPLVSAADTGRGTLKGKASKMNFFDRKGGADVDEQVPVLSLDNIMLLFGCVETIVDDSRSLFHDLSARSGATWDVDRTCVADVLLERFRSAGYQQVYASYCEQYERAMQLYQQLCAERPDFVAFVDAQLAGYDAYLTRHGIAASADVASPRSDTSTTSATSLSSSSSSSSSSTGAESALDLASYLIMPIQRLPRYLLLLDVRAGPTHDVAVLLMSKK